MTISDDENSTFKGENRGTYTVRLEILGVNDPPTFEFNSALSSIELPETDVIKPYRATLATSIFSGPPNERATCNPASQTCDAQTFSFQIAHVSDPDLFTWRPSIDTTGQLSFALTPNAVGSAVVSVYLKDSGSSSVRSNGTRYGSDVSALYKFTVIVNTVNDPPAFSFESNIDCTVEDADQRPVCLTTATANASAKSVRVQVLQRKGSDQRDAGIRSFVKFATLVSPAKGFVPGSMASFDLGMYMHIIRTNTYTHMVRKSFAWKHFIISALLHYVCPSSHCILNQVPRQTKFHSQNWIKTRS